VQANPTKKNYHNEHLRLTKYLTNAQGNTVQLSEPRIL